MELVFSYKFSLPYIQIEPASKLPFNSTLNDNDKSINWKTRLINGKTEKRN